ncbi:MAG TPA: PilZ domain-containing protein [Nitrospiria bacterium]|nr:PilZ domain-containing protein [Nitrospiria bacterium]
MQDKRKQFRYQFPQTTKTICSDEGGNRLIPLDISDGGIGFYAEREHAAGTVEIIHLLEFVTVEIKINNCIPAGPSGKMFKIGAEFVDYTLTPQKLIEFLEMNMLKGNS